MIVISQDGERIVDCNEITRKGREIVGYVTACPGCEFVVETFETEEEAVEIMKRVIRIIIRQIKADNAIVINFSPIM